MRSTRFALIAALMLLPVAAQAKPKWHTIFKNKNVSVAMDTAGITGSASDFYTVWTRWDYATAKPLENKKTYSRLMEKVQIKCDPTRVKRVSTSLYNKAGKVVKEEDSATPEELEAMTWDPPRAGSDGESVFAAVCKELGPKPAKPVKAKTTTKATKTTSKAVKK
jgi:hypothetical protein